MYLMLVQQHLLIFKESRFNMGWLCNSCGNTRGFIEINRVRTLVQQAPSTEIRKIVNLFEDEPLMTVTCDRCGSADVRWKDVGQESSYLYEQEFISQDHKVKTISLEVVGKKEMSFELIKRIVEENKRLKCPVSNFELGSGIADPMSHSRIQDIVNLIGSPNILTFAKDLPKEALTMKQARFSLFTDDDEPYEAYGLLSSNGIAFDILALIDRNNCSNIDSMRKAAKDAENFIPVERFPFDSEPMDDDMKKAVLKYIDDHKIFKNIQYSASRPNNTCAYLRKQRLFIDSEGKLSFCHFLSPMENTCIVEVKDMPLIEMIHRNNRVMQGFMNNKKKLFSSWKQPRETASPCSYCLHAFRLDKKW